MTDQSPNLHPASPLLDHCPPSLPAACYYDEAVFDREQELIWRRNWLYVGRNNDLPAGTMRRLNVAGQNLILVKDRQGTLTCFYNTCRHRGSELCTVAEKSVKFGLILCPYHFWSYDLSGKLVRTPIVTLTDDFNRDEYGLLSVAVKLWNGCIFICLKKDAPDFAAAPDLGIDALDNWPMESLVTGHAMAKELDCNWKVFWENYNECLHCPGIHPELCDMVPVYGKGIMAPNEDVNWTPEAAQPAHGLKAGARSWTVNGQPCGPEFPDLTDAQRDAGHTFVTLLPNAFIVAHVDYVRIVTVTPLAPEKTELKAEWLFLRETMEAPGFDLANVVDFARTVMLQDGGACEINQRGLRNAAFERGRLMPQEFDVYRFHKWLERHIDYDAAAAGETR